MMDQSLPHVVVTAPQQSLLAPESQNVVGDVIGTTTTIAVVAANKQQQQQPPPNRFQNSMRLLLKQASEFQQQQQQLQQKHHNSVTLNTNVNKSSSTNESVVIEDGTTSICNNVNPTASSRNVVVETETVPPGYMKNAAEAVMVDDSQQQQQQQAHPPLLLKQAGVALQQQIRGLRRRVKSVRSLQQQQQQSGKNSHMMDSSRSHNSESHNDNQITELKNVLSLSLRKKVPIVSPTTLHDNDEDLNDTLDVSKLTPKKLSPISKNTIKIDLQQRNDQVNRSSSSIMIAHPESLYEAIHIWYDACYDLLTGPEMIRLLHCTGCVYYHSIRFGIQTMTLPITIPIHIGYNVGDWMVQTTLSILPIPTTNVPLLSQQQSSGQVSEEEDEHSHHIHHHHHDRGGFLGGILSLPGTILDVTGKVVIAIVAPVLGGGGSKEEPPIQHPQNQATGASSSPEEREKAVLYAKTPSRYPMTNTTTNGRPDYLERLRLDYAMKDVDPMPRRKLFSSIDNESTKKPLGNTKNLISAPVMEQSEFLLRVNDWGVSRPTDDGDLYYIDISPSAMKSSSNENNIHQELVTMALDRFVQGAILLLNTHPICQIVVDNTASDGGSTLAQQQRMSHTIQWHPEGSTKRILRERSQASSTTMNNQINPFKDEILIWSGRFQHEVQNGYGRKHGFFLARGCIPMSPDNFVKLLWDNTRTSEYNNFCLGRFTLHGLSCSSTNDDDHAFLNGTSKTASKVIQSEMRVPFAGITVKAVCLMHVRPLTTNDGYIICSRSLDIGPSGIQTATTIINQQHNNNSNGNNIITPAKNEILWGVNVIRSMPNHLNGTELTSLSQVGSAVPSFLAQKIGLMGIGDFFKNVRQVAEKTNE